jgi:CRISPR system Cascade subunit CasE
VWTLFGDGPDRERDFLWREADGGVFHILSRRLPDDRHGLFDLDEPHLFRPALSPGDRLAFMLRANATVAKAAERNQRGKPSDIVMNALREVPSGERAAVRPGLLRPVARAWMERQGNRAGFVIPADRDEPSDDGKLRVTAYRTLRVTHAGPVARIGVLDLEGELEIRDPSLFLNAVVQGFGRAKAFGCGLMLLRHARQGD